MFKLAKTMTSVVFFICTAVVHAADVNVGDFDLGKKDLDEPVLALDGSQGIQIEEMVSGFWTLGEDIVFSQAGSYELALTDFVYPEAFKYLNASIIDVSSDEVIAEFVYESGATTEVNPIFFDVDEDKYILSVIAVTDKYSANMGKFGLSINEVTQVPLPGALYFMFSALAALAVFRRKQAMAG